MTGGTAITGAGRGPLFTVTVTLLLTSFIAAAYGFGFYLFSLIVTDMRTELGFGYTATGIVTAGAQIGFLAFAYAGGLLSPRMGGTQVVLGSVLLCGICLTALPAFSSIWTIGALLAILGGCAASVYVPMVELVSRVVRFEHRGKVLGLVSSGTSYGVFINGLIVPYFILNGDWRGIWLTVGTGTLLLGAVALVTFARLGLLGRKPAGPRAEPRPIAGPPAAPSRTAMLIWTITFLNGFTLLPFQNYLAPYLRDELGFGVAVASQVWAVIGLIGMGAGFAVGALADRIGIRTALVLSYACVLASASLILAAPGPATLTMAGTAFALAFYPIFGLVPAYISKTASGAASTTIFGIANVTLGLGGMLGNFLGGWSAEHLGTFQWIYVSVGAVSVALALLCAALPSEHARPSG